jgi:hypothetical protein
LDQPFPLPQPRPSAFGRSSAVALTRRAERLVAVMEQIGIAEELYPAICRRHVRTSAALPDLFSSRVDGSGPSFQWNILNYGRLLNNIRLQDATLQELIAVYQQRSFRPVPKSKMEGHIPTGPTAAELPISAAAQTAVWAI